MWRDEIVDIVKSYDHPAWGFSHFKRVYNLTLDLAKFLDKVLDEESIFAAAYLHDLGAFKPYRQEGKDHSETAIEHCDEILNRIGFPSVKIFKVKEIIRNHMYYSNPSEASIESIVFHDADTLDFMGVIGITRILSIVGIDDWTSSLPDAIKLIEKFSQELPQKLYTEKAQQIGNMRKKEMVDFLEKIREQTNNFEFL